MSKTRILALGTVVGAIALGAAFFSVYTRSFDYLKFQGNPIVRSINEFRESRGRYPTALDEIGQEAPVTRYGRWEYESDGSSFTLSIGDYHRDGFVLYFSSRLNSWVTDT